MAIFRRGKKIAVSDTDIETLIENKQDKLVERGTYYTPGDGDYLSGLYRQDSVLGFKSLTFNGLWTWICGRHSKAISASSTDLEAPTSKAVWDALPPKLYAHNMMVRFNDGNKKCKFQIVTAKSETYSTTEFGSYMKNNYSNTSSNITGNLAAVVPAIGYLKSGTTWYDVLGIAYSTDHNTVCPVIRQVGAASNQLYVDNSHAGVFTVTDTVVAL